MLELVGSPSDKADENKTESLSNKLSSQDYAAERLSNGKEKTSVALPSLSIVANAQAVEAKATALPQAKVIEVPPSEELDSADWHRHDHRPKKDLPGEYVGTISRRVAPDQRVTAALDQIRGDEMKRSLEEISGAREVMIDGKPVKIESRSTYEKGTELALKYFKDKFEKEGYTVVLDTYTRRGQSYQNLRAIKPGKNKADEVVMFGAHIDSTAGYPWSGEKKAPGANDDGSGAVALVQIAKAMKDLPLDRTVVFSLFSGEEQGLWGSRAMAELYKQSQANTAENLNAGKDGLGKIVGMYQLDMIGYAPGGTTVESHDTTSDKACHALTELLAAKQKQYNIDLKVYGAHNEELTNRSDHYPFYRNGIPAVLITEPYDTAEVPNPDYHSTRDTVDKVNIPYMVDVSKLATAAGVELAGLRMSAAGRELDNKKVISISPLDLRKRVNE